MDEVGVDGAVLVSPFSMYRYDASYAMEVYAAHPSRFRLVKPIHPIDPRVADTIADWASTKGTVGIRVFLRDTASTDPADPAINRVLAMAGRHSLPVNLACTGRLEQAAQLAARNPNTQVVIDHLGLQQPPAPPAPPQPFAELPMVLALASHPNIAIKISGACTLSHEPFPYKDIWDPLGRIFDAFSLSRPSRNQTRISNALRPRPYGLSWMICRFTSARIFPQRGCKLNEPNGFEPLRRVHDRIIRVLWPINFAHKRQRVRS
jgi:predicted TIM-barrel fold metal-dependent hydrolase